MTYSYQCQACHHSWDELVPMSQRDEPCAKKCPGCSKKGKITRELPALKISYDVIGPLKRAGTGWNDVLNRIKKGSGKQSNIETR